MKPFTLSSASLTLDAPTRHDIDDIVRYCRDPLFESGMSTPWPYGIEHAHGFVDTIVPRGWDTGREFTWAVRTVAMTPLVGMISVRNDTATHSSLGFWIGAEHRNHGYAAEAVRLVCDWAFEAGRESMGWECFVGNQASAGVAHHAGFHFAGTAPAIIPARDGSHPPAWHGVLRRLDSRSPHNGWPLKVIGATAEVVAK